MSNISFPYPSGIEKILKAGAGFAHRTIAPIDPLLVPGLETYYDMSDAAGFVLNGSDVISRVDSSGNGHTITDQGNPAFRPSYDGSKEVYFDGTGERLADMSFSGALDSVQDFTVLGLAYNLSANGYFCTLGDAVYSHHCFVVSANPWTYSIVYNGDALSSVYEYLSGSSPYTQSLHSFAFRRDHTGAGKITIFSEGVKIAEKATSIALAIKHGGDLVLGEARAVGNDRPQQGGTRQLMIYRRALSDYEILRLTAFMDEKK